MKIGDRDITFRMNLRATKSVAALCPNRDLTRMMELFDRSDMVEFLDTMTEIAIAMSMNKANDKPLTAEEVADLDISDLNQLIAELRSAFVRDKQTNVDTVDVKKNEEKAEQLDSD